MGIICRDDYRNPFLHSPLSSGKFWIHFGVSVGAQDPRFVFQACGMEVTASQA